jgi:hypothetical protein
MLKSGKHVYACPWGARMKENIKK